MVAVPGQIDVLPEIVQIGGIQFGTPAETEPVVVLLPTDTAGALND